MAWIGEGARKGRASVRHRRSIPMKRSAFLVTQSIALVGAVLLTFNLAGCSTVAHPMSVDASAGLIPSGRGAP
jgi:hypothetical protein